jgi:probable F420-dependent oxidoreductase
MPVEIGLSLTKVRLDQMPEFARRAEELGYESVFAPDHLLVPVNFASRYPGTRDGDFPYPKTTPLYDPWMALMQIAQVTTTIKLGTGIYVLPMRHPIVTARMVTTLDVVSGGRAILGVGAGWLKEEFQALGIDPGTRFRRTEEAAEAIRVLWTEPEPEYHGTYFDFNPVHFEPKPVASPHPPILFGGYSEGALRRAIRFGDGWLSGGDHAGLDDIAALMRRIEELRDELAIDRPFQVTLMGARPEPALLEGMAEAGVDRVAVMPWTRARDAFAAMEAYAEEASRVLH